MTFNDKSTNSHSIQNLIVNMLLVSVCGFPLGVNNGELPTDSFSASSNKLSSEPWAARLNRVIGSGAWCSGNNAIGEYLEVDLGHKCYVTAISTQGQHGLGGNWVTEYTLLHRLDADRPSLPYKVNGTTKVQIFIL